MLLFYVDTFGKMGYNKLRSAMGLRALLRREKNEIYAPVAQLDRANAS